MCDNEKKWLSLVPYAKCSIKTCIPGYSLNSRKTTCIKNICKCDNGTPKKDEYCTTNGASMCAGCTTGYTINSGETKCKKNTCKCDNGTSTVGIKCPTNGASMCVRCKNGYHLADSNTKCEKNTCKCDNGTSTVGSNCPNNGATMCAGCTTGYTINSDKTKCEKNTCKCDNGTPTLGRQCPTNGASLCAECDTGYTMNGDGTNCSQNMCTCQNGTPAWGSKCSTNGASLCAECKIGYHLTDSNTKCIEARRLPFILKAESSHWGNEGPKYLSWSGGQRSLPNGKKYAIWDPRKSKALRLNLTSEGVLYTEIDGHVRYLNMYFDAADGKSGWVRGAIANFGWGLTPIKDGPLIFPVWESVNKGGITTFTGGKMKFTINNKTYDIESVFPYRYLDKEGNITDTYSRLSNSRDYGELTTKGSRLIITKVVP